VHEGGPRWEEVLGHMGWVRDQQAVFIFDEAQLTYRDGDLWGNFFKAILLYSKCRAIAFASYGSPASRVNMAGTPFFIMDTQRITLRPTQHDDDIAPVGLLFTQPEFDQLVAKLYPGNRFHTSLLSHAFEITGGHIGALCDLFNIILSHRVCMLLMLK